MWQHYNSFADYCGTDQYREWLRTWQPPSQWPVDQWIDSEADQWQWTPRQHGLTRWSTRLFHHLVDSVDVGAHRTVDIGCGENLLAQVYDTVTGVDPRFAADEQLTDQWWHTNQGQWPRAIAVNSMHFVSDVKHIADQLKRVQSVLTDQGQAMVTLNRHMIPNSDQLWHMVPLWQGISRAVWIDQPANAPVDGNVWLWLRSVA